MRVLFWVIAMAGGPPLMPVVLAALMALVCRHAFGPLARDLPVPHPLHGRRA